ncbi:MAG: site-specific integrase [Bacteroidales bacterium]|nr:site-specific integrase [Bacteroidales bacterium]
MARPKKVLKAKEPVKIRFKALANGNQAIYLDIYRGKKCKEGEKIREYKFLDLYLIPEIDSASKVKNQNTLEEAVAEKNKMIEALKNAKNGIAPNPADEYKNLLLIDWVGVLIEKKEKEMEKAEVENKAKIQKRIQLYQAVKKLLISYKGEKILLANVDKEYCLGFMDFLKSAKSAYGRKFEKSTTWLYNSTFITIMKDAVRNKVRLTNPYDEIDRKDKIAAPKTDRPYLSAEELKLMIDTDIKSHSVKQAFLFGCFCGLRLSDIEKLTWGDIRKDSVDGKERWRADVVMKKTGHKIVVSLSDEARKWIPERNGKSNDEKVFILPPAITSIERFVKIWAAKAGIEKKVTFHTSRHTFATLMLTLGADLYTVSKMLGHQDLKTTQIYADIIDKKKDQAVDLVNGIF